MFQTISLIGSILVISILAKSKLLRKWLTSFIPSGKGPNKKERKGHWFELKIFAHTESQIVTTTVSGGDPGYGETAKFIAEMALCITCDNDKLNIDKGVITPAQCAGNLMIERLKNRGIKFEHKLKDLT